MRDRADDAAVGELATAHLAARALHAVTRLAVADVLDHEPLPAGALAASVRAEPDALERVLRLLAAHGVFAAEPDGRWRHTARSRLLRADHDRSLRPRVLMWGLPSLWSCVGALEETVRSGRAAVPLDDAGGLWGHLSGDPDELGVFQDAMAARSDADVAALVDAVDFGRYRRIVDVGGGSGHLVRGVLDRVDGPEAVLFDLPEVAEREPQAHRFDVVGGDFFRDPLPAGDCYLLGDVLHDWSDEDAVRILRAVAGAGRETGATVLVLETLRSEASDASDASDRATVLDVAMLVMTGGRQRTTTEHRGLIEAAGLEWAGVTETATSVSVVAARATSARR